MRAKDMSDQTLLDNKDHRAMLLNDASRQLDFFAKSLRSDGGFDTLHWDGTAMQRGPQELHTTTRLVHSYALGHAFGYADSEHIIDAGIAFLWNRHRDANHGGYVWSVEDNGTADDTKLAYGHVFVLLAAASAKQAGHPDADRLIDDISDVLERHFWDDDRGLFKEEYQRDWTTFSTYRGMNANMHGVEALLAAFEATGRDMYLTCAGRILDFFVGQIAPDHDWRIPEHYTQDWQVDGAYSGKVLSD
jgi:mannose/cellobiose epimerase-like protein (N-acyl-D-glucosamine 2-epimerase family)